MVTTIRKTVGGYPHSSGSGAKGYQTSPPGLPRHDTPTPGRVPPGWRPPVIPHKAPDYTPGRYVKKPPKYLPQKEKSPARRKREHDFPKKGKEPLRRVPRTVPFGKRSTVPKDASPTARSPWVKGWGTVAKGVRGLPLDFFVDPVKRGTPVVPANWSWCQGPVIGNLPGCVGTNVSYWLTPSYFSANGSCTLVPPLGGQQPSNLPVGEFAPDAFTISAYLNRIHYGCAPPGLDEYSGLNNARVIEGTIQRVIPYAVDEEVPYVRPDWTIGVGNPWAKPEVYIDTFPFPLVNRPVPEHVPYRVIPRVRPDETGVPSERSERGNTIPPPPVTTSPVTAPRHTLPGRPPLFPPPVVNTSPAIKPPGKKVKERKIRATGVLAAVYHGANTATEIQDFFDAAYKALPKKLQTARTPIQRDKAVYRHWQDIDITQLAKNVVANQLEDAFYGGLGRLRGKALRNLGVNPYVSWNTSGTLAYANRGAMMGS